MNIFKLAMIRDREQPRRAMPFLPWLFLFVPLMCSPFSLLNAAEPASPTYQREIRPLLAKHCTICHNVNKKQTPDVSGGLALDTIEAILAGTGRRKVVASGKADESELVKRLSDPDEDRRMPLSEDPLTDSEQLLIRRWIDLGMPRGAGDSSPKPLMSASGEYKSDTPATPRPIHWRRTIDIVIPFGVKLKDGEGGISKGGPLKAVAKIGPLPPVGSLAFRSDGRILAAGSYGQVVLWDLVEFRPIRTIGGFPGPIHSLSFSRDGKKLAVGSGAPARTGIVRIHSIPDGKLLHDFAGHGDVVFGIAFRKDEAQIASASFDQTIRLWNLATGKEDGIFRGHSDFVEAISYSQDGRSILSAGKDRAIKRLNGTTLKEEQAYSSHDEDVLSLAVHPDGKHFVSAGNEPQIRWWTFSSAEPIRKQGGHRGPVHQLVFSRDGRKLISASGDGSVKIWNGSSGALLRTLTGTAEWQYSTAITDDGKLVCSGGWDGLIHLWDAESGKHRGILVQVPTPSVSINANADYKTDWLALADVGYLTGSASLLEIGRAQVSDARLPSALFRSVIANSQAAVKALAGETVPPLKLESDKRPVATEKKSSEPTAAKSQK